MSVVAPAGFRAGGVAAGIKPAGRADLAMVATADGRPVPASAVFTSNLAAAAPVAVSREHLASTGGRAAGVLINSGNANAATGEAGLATARRSCSALASALGSEPEEILVCSTGLIGVPLAAEGIEAAVPVLVGAAGGKPADGLSAALAIMTTDSRPKETVVETPRFTIGGLAKGAAMLAPDMATMLAVLTTDAAAPPGILRRALRQAVGPTFNALSVDGCASTNDTVVLLAGGSAGPAEPSELVEALGRACSDLAMQMAADAEGASKVVLVKVTGARTDADARRAARRVAESPLVKCSFHGADPYWGRVLSELGSAGVAFEMSRAQVAYGPTVVCRAGQGVDHDSAAVSAHLGGERVEVAADLGLGSGAATVTTVDLGHGYIDENERTS